MVMGETVQCIHLQSVSILFLPEKFSSSSSIFTKDLPSGCLTTSINMKHAVEVSSKTVGKVGVFMVTSSDNLERELERVTRWFSNRGVVSQ